MDFKTVIKEQREELEKIEDEEGLVNREAANKAKEFLKYPNIPAVVGV